MGIPPISQSQVRLEAALGTLFGEFTEIPKKRIIIHIPDIHPSFKMGGKRLSVIEGYI